MGPEHPSKSADQRATGGQAACKVVGVLRTDFAHVLVAGGVGPAFMWGRCPRAVGGTASSFPSITAPSQLRGKGHTNFGLRSVRKI